MLTLDVDVLTIESIDEAMSSACEWLVEGEAHGVEAEYLLVLKCCGANQPLCEAHAAVADHALQVGVSFGYVLMCAACGMSSPAWEFLPIGGGS